jgi:hypothetical protein
LGFTDDAKQKGWRTLYIAPTTRPIPGSGKDGFQHALDLIERASEALLREIRERRSNVCG